jgi:hypothetical protein
VPDSELCAVRVCRVTAATEVRYAAPAAPGPDEPEPLNAPAAAATATPAATTTITTPATTQRRVLPPRAVPACRSALWPEETVPLIVVVPLRWVMAALPGTNHGRPTSGRRAHCV